MAGFSTSSRSSLPYFLTASAVPRTMPGTPTATPCRLEFGTPTNMSGVAPAGAFSRVSITKVRPPRARWINMKPPPPMPADCGSTTLSA
jgi:hypothetical protein